MHELSIAQNVVRQAEDVARRDGAARVLSVKLRVGPLAAVNGDVLCGHFAEAARGTLAEGAELDVLIDDEITAASPELMIESVELEVD